MREMKDSGIEWIGEIPTNWDVMPNKYLMHKTKTICPVYHGEDILSLSMNGIIVRDLDAGGKMPTSFDGYQKVEAGNLLMCLFDIDVTPRCVGLIKQSGVTSPAYSQFVLSGNADAPYYCYYYTMLDNDKTLLHLAKNLRHSLTEEQLGTVMTVVPPISEQKVIADFLDDKCAEIDELTSDIKSQIDMLEQYKRSVITEAVTKGLNPDAEMKDSGVEWIGKIPKDWKVVPTRYNFKAHKSVVGGKADEFDRLALTMKGVIKRAKEDNNGLQPEKFETYQILKKGELVFKLIDLQNISTSRVGLSPYTGIVSPAYVVLYSTGEVLPEYAEKWFLSMWQRQVFNYLGDEGVRSSLNTGNLLDVPIAYPSITQQQQIADYLDEKCSNIDAILEGRKAELATLKEYKKSLIYEYVTGKKEVPTS